MGQKNSIFMYLEYWTWVRKLHIYVSGVTGMDQGIPYIFIWRTHMDPVNSILMYLE